MAEARAALDKLERLTGMSRRELECYDEELIAAWRSTDLDEQTVWRIRRVHRLRRHLGLDYEAIEIIIRLLDRIELLEAARERHGITVRVLDQ